MLATDTPHPIPAAVVHDGATLGQRVFLALVTDRAVVVRSAHQLDTDHRELAVEDLTADQRDFTLLTTDPQGWIDEHKTASPGARPHGIYRIGADGLPDPRGGRPFT